jgi:aminodeoxyfutalosine deaminase
LLDYLHEHQVPLEICPTSNLCLGLYTTYQDHPIRRLWQEGIYLTVNSDDPPMFDTDLTREYGILADFLCFCAADLERLSLNALQASFLSEEQKATLAQTFVAQFADLHVKHLGQEGTI